MFAHLITPKAPFEITLTTRPIAVDYTPSRVLSFLFMFVGLAWCGFSRLAPIDFSDLWSILISGGLMCMGLGIFVFLGLRSLMFSRVVTFRDTGVTVHERGLLGRRDWQARYSEFEGISVRRFARTHRHASHEVLQIIEMIAPNRLPITLAVIASTDEPRVAVEKYAKAFAVPILDSGATPAPSQRLTS